MNRYYGVIKDRTTSDEFINKFLEAASLQGRYRDVVRNNVILSDYTYLTTMGDASKAQMMQHLADTGYIKEAMTYEGELAVLDSLTRNPESANLTGLEYQNASIIRFASNLYLIVVRGLTAAEIEGGASYDDPTWFNDSLTQVKILHVVPEEVTTTDPETGETTTTTVYHSTVFQLGSNNSNTLAPAVAYEITSTYSGDVLVKLAWCPNECAGTEENLKSVMSALDICTYTADIEGSGDTAHAVLKNANGGHGHTAEVFGAGGPRGGFLYNIMENGSYGLTIFNSDRTPLYTWSADAGSYDAVDSTGTCALNVNLGGFGRVINDEKVNESSKEYVIKMTALAPLFCPATKKKAKYAKWMPQGLHDYSYFDKSGHIRLKGSKSEDSVFFADHGVYLFDGPASDFSESSRMTPDAMPENLVVIKRPDPSNAMPGSNGMWAYFDCRDGLSRNGWMNFYDEGNDMLFTNGPVINSDGSAHFVNRYSNPITGMVPNGKWCARNISLGAYSCYFMIAKWSTVNSDPGNWDSYLAGMLFDKRANAPNESINNEAIFTSGSTWYNSDTWNARRQLASPSKDTWYIIACYTRQNNDTVINVYNMSGSLIASGSFNWGAYNVNDRIFDSAMVICGDPIGRWYMDGYPNSTTKTIMQGKKRYSPWDTQYPNIQLETNLDVKFFAAGIHDPNDVITYDHKMSWSPAENSSIYNDCISWLSRNFNV